MLGSKTGERNTHRYNSLQALSENGTVSVPLSRGGDGAVDMSTSPTRVRTHPCLELARALMNEQLVNVETNVSQHVSNFIESGGQRVIMLRIMRKKRRKRKGWKRV